MAEAIAAASVGAAKKWRAAVVGCGWIGSAVADDPLADGIQAHAAAYAGCAGTELVAVCDTDANNAERAARRWGLERGLRDLDTLLQQARPQIVSVCTPDATHAAVLRQVLSSRDVRAVVAEKPLALDPLEARALVALARSRGVLLAVNYSRRFAASHIEARRRLAMGEIGTLQAVQGVYSKGVVHNGTHWFDLARWLVGEIVRVQAWQRVGETLPSESVADPTCDVRLIFCGGQVGFLAGLNEAHFSAFEMDVIGSAGRLRIAESGMRIEWFAAAPSPHYSGYRTLVARGEAPGGFRDVALRMVENVVESLRDGSRPHCTGEDGVAALAVAEAARASLRTGTEQTVEGIG